MSEETTRTEAEAVEAEEPRTAWQEFVKRQEAALDHAGKAIRGLFPDATVEHFNKALDEFGQGWRTLLNDINEKGLFTIKITKGKKDGEAGNDDDKPSTTGKKKVKIDVE